MPQSSSIVVQQPAEEDADHINVHVEDPAVTAAFEGIQFGDVESLKLVNQNDSMFNNDKGKPQS